jgi:hypothetical protein
MCEYMEAVENGEIEYLWAKLQPLLWQLY